MSAQDAKAWLESELNGFSERANGEGIYQYFVRISQKPLSSDAQDRQLLVDALRDWLCTRTEPRTMLAVEIVAAHRLFELRPEVEHLLETVKAGRAFLPHYALNLSKALERIPKGTR